MTDSQKSLLKSFKHFLTGSLLSRGTGFFREVVMAMTFGVSPAIASFWMAFRFANLFRRLFGEGGLNVAFIPHYEELKKKDPALAGSFFIHLSNRLMMILLFLICLLEIILGSFLIFKPLSQDSAETIRLTMILLPALLFLSHFALNSALLNSEKNYFLPSAAPTIVNILWILAALIIPYFAPEKALTYLAMSIVFAFAVQWFATAIPAYSFSRGNPTSQKEPLLPILKPFLLTIIGVTAQQINGAIDALFAKAADPEGPAILWYAIRLQQLPFALFGVGLMNSLLPPLSRATDDKTFQNLLNFSLKKICVFMIPLTMAIFAGGLAAVNLVYGRGAFSEAATYETAFCLMAYGLSLLPMSWTLLCAASFYAKKNYKTPTLCSLISIFCNILLNALFVYVFHLKAISIALATTLSSLLNAFLLSQFLNQSYKEYKQSLWLKMSQVSFVSFLSLSLSLFCGHFLISDNTLRLWLQIPLAPLSRSFVSQLFSMGIVSAVFGSSLFLFSYLFKIEEMMDFIKILKRQKN